MNCDLLLTLRCLSGCIYTICGNAFSFDLVAVMFSSSHGELTSSLDELIRVELFMQQSTC